MEFRRRDIFLKIEPLLSYSPLAPVVCSRRYGRDCMYNVGHEYGRVQADEILAHFVFDGALAPCGACPLRPLQLTESHRLCHGSTLTDEGLA